MNIIKKLIENRANKLLDELDVLSDKISNRSVNAMDSLSPVEIAKAGTLPPEDLREFLSIQNRLNSLTLVYDSMFTPKT